MGLLSDPALHDEDQRRVRPAVGVMTFGVMTPAWVNGMAGRGAVRIQPQQLAAGPRLGRANRVSVVLAGFFCSARLTLPSCLKWRVSHAEDPVAARCVRARAVSVSRTLLVTNTQKFRAPAARSKKKTASGGPVWCFFLRPWARAAVFCLFS